MAQEALSAAEKGAALISQVGRVDFSRVPVIKPQGILIDEFSKPRSYDTFVTLPPEIADLFPGSYVSPDDFLKSLTGAGEYVQKHVQELLGDRVGTAQMPVFSWEEQADGTPFSLKVANGLANPHALAMSRLAYEAGKLEQGFADPGYGASVIRAQYQDAMKSGIQSALESEEQEKRRGKAKDYAVRIHDDCGATGESVVNFLIAQMSDASQAETYRNRGVKIVIDGPITAQAVLYMRAFSKNTGVPLDIDAGHMAFGLTNGEMVSGKRQHANYITYPEPLVAQLAEGEAKRTIRQIRQETGSDPQVVGDMGEAEKGIEKGHMDRIREEAGAEFCGWNDTRCDVWGSHPRSGEGITVIPNPDKGATDLVYLARGGYIPYAFDLLHNRNLMAQGNVVILRASRFTATDAKTREEYGFGVGFGIPEGVQVRNTE
jgi:hypothetical protein